MMFRELSENELERLLADYQRLMELTPVVDEWLNHMDDEPPIAAPPEYAEFGRIHKHLLGASWFLYPTIITLRAENALLRKLLDAAGIAAVDTNVSDGDYVADGM